LNLIVSVKQRLFAYEPLQFFENFVLLKDRISSELTHPRSTDNSNFRPNGNSFQEEICDGANQFIRAAVIKDFELDQTKSKKDTVLLDLGYTV